MSAFDDEFGLFGDEAGEEEERRSTLGARKIATGETIIDEIEPEDERPARRVRAPGPPGERTSGDDAAGSRWPRRRAQNVKRDPLPDEIAHPRAIELLMFLAKRLVGKPDAVFVDLHPDARGAVLELEVDADDLGKVIGRGGRVAQALRTIVRAGAEGRVTIDIVDADDEAEDGDRGKADDAPMDAMPVASATVARVEEPDGAVAADEAVAVRKAPRKRATAKPAVKSALTKAASVTPTSDEKKPARKRKPKADAE